MMRPQDVKMSRCQDVKICACTARLEGDESRGRCVTAVNDGANHMGELRGIGTCVTPTAERFCCSLRRPGEKNGEADSEGVPRSVVAEELS